MTTIIDYGMGNLRSVEKALEHLGHRAQVTSDPAVVRGAERVILPGVGAFGAAMDRLRKPRGEAGTLAEAFVAVAEAGRPALGICLGMQLLLSSSEEFGSHAGLDLIPGRVRRFRPRPEEALKVPHMGWNQFHPARPSPLLAGMQPEEWAYFVHSYYCAPEDGEAVAATALHGPCFAAVLWRGNLHGAQFHPEKSGAAGLRLLDNFARLSAEGVGCRV
jgi:imidazole glycerol-phosphate synthase subunit HisH